MPIRRENKHRYSNPPQRQGQGRFLMTPLLSLSEAAQRLACSSTTIRRLVANGVLPVVRIGRLIRIDPADLTAMIYAQKKLLAAL